MLKTISPLLLLYLAVARVAGDSAYKCLEPCSCRESSSEDPVRQNHVDKLEMVCVKDREVEGNLDSFLANFPNLTHLNLSRIPLTYLPQSVCKMHRLQSLHVISSNLNSAGIPNGCFRELQNLQDLNLYDNYIDNISTAWISGLPNLTHLNLSFNMIDSIPSDFSTLYLPKLTFLTLQKNSLTTIDSWPLKFVLQRETKEILEIDLQYNNIINFTDIANWRQYAKFDAQQLLGEIDFWGNKIAYLRDIFNGWKLLPAEKNRNQSIVTIDICGNEFICDCIDNEWRKFLTTEQSRTLPIGFHERVEFVQCVAPPILAQKLQLSVSERDFICNIIEHCPKECNCLEIPAIKSLKVDCSVIKDRSKLLKSLPNVLPPLKSMSSIHDNFTYHLDFSGNDISVLRYEPYLEWASYLDLSNNKLNNISLKALKSLEKVKALFLDGNQLTSLPEGISMCKSLVNMSVITLHGNKWQCGCEAEETWRWITKHINSINDPDQIICTDYDIDTKNHRVESLYTIQDTLDDCRRHDRVFESYNWIIISIVITVSILMVIVLVWFCRRRISRVITNCRIGSCPCVHDAKHDEEAIMTSGMSEVSVVDLDSSALSQNNQVARGRTNEKHTKSRDSDSGSANDQQGKSQSKLPNGITIKSAKYKPKGDMTGSRNAAFDGEAMVMGSAEPSANSIGNKSGRAFGSIRYEEGFTHCDEGLKAEPLQSARGQNLDEAEVKEIASEDWDLKSHKSLHSGTEEKTCDAFISFNSEDETYVIANIAEKLESFGYKTMYSRRDFMPGNSIIQNIADVVECSARTVFYCSRQFFVSNFCKWEMHYVADQCARLNQKTFIIIKSKKFIDKYPGEFTEILQGFKIGMFTYIDEDGPYFWEQFLKAMQKTDNISDL